MKLEFSEQIFENFPNIKLHENPSCGRRVVPYGQTDERTDMMKLTGAFRNFAKAPKMAVIKNVIRVLLCTMYILSGLVQ